MGGKRMKPSCFFFLFTGVILCGVGSKWQLIGLFGSDVPYMDQWNGEATTAILPWLDGNFDLVQTFWTPHNEHRLGFTRLWALALTSFNGQWDPLFVTTLNALVHVAFSAFLLFLLQHALHKLYRWQLISAFEVLVHIQFSFVSSFCLYAGIND